MEPLVIAQRFDCAICGKEAGRISLFGSESASSVEVNTFVTKMTAGVASSQFKNVVNALETKDAGVLFQVDFEFAPFFCPKCNLSYCRDHWITWVVFDEELSYMIDCTKGRCPERHERMLID